MADPFEPKITAFVCNWCTYAGATDRTSASSINQYPHHPPALHRPHRFHAVAEGFRPWRGRHHRLRLPSERLPLQQRQLPCAGAGWFSTT